MTADLRPTVVGPGRVGGSLAAALAAAGSEPVLRGRSREPPGPVDPGPPVRYLPGLPDGADSGPLTLVFAVPDDALEGAAAAWAEALAGSEAGKAEGEGRPGEPAPDDRPPAGRFVALHTSGVHPPGALAPLARAGYAVGGWHPLTAVADVDPGAFSGCAVGLAGEAAAVERGRTLARAVGARPLTVAEGAHARYHAAAVLASNALVACLSAARSELAEATDGAAGLEDLLPLARAALGHVERHGLDRGLTGPVDRGDVETVRRDMAALGRGRSELYRRLARELLDVAGERLPAGRRRALRELLDD